MENENEWTSTTVYSNTEILPLSLFGKIEGKRAKCRQRMMYLDNIKEWTNTANGNEVIQACQEIEAWKCMIVNALVHDT